MRKTCRTLLLGVILLGTLAFSYRTALPTPELSKVPHETVRVKALKATSDAEKEMRGVWISYLDWNEWPKDQKGFKATVDKVLDQSVSLGMNTVFVHVRSDGDAMYPSSYFPWSKFASGKQGKNPGYDPLEYLISAAHERNLAFHAWINPYRVTGYLNSWEDVADISPAKKWLNDNDKSNDRFVLYHRGEYYFNPAKPEVRQLITNGVKEIVDKYEVDGIHFDDYFYPEIDDASDTLSFDKVEYDKSGSGLTIAQWRRKNVNELVKNVYATVKASKPDVWFGISPEGYVGNLRSNSRLFVDIDTWMSTPGYIDYVIPQIYWGFEQKTSKGEAAAFAYSNNLKTWVELKKKGNVKLYIGLAMYKTASDAKDNNEIPEWLRYNDIMKRQVEEGRKTEQISGYCFYSYSSFLRPEAKEEVANLKKVFR